jgi:hypothetical protein
MPLRNHSTSQPDMPRAAPGAYRVRAGQPGTAAGTATAPGGGRVRQEAGGTASGTGWPQSMRAASGLSMTAGARLREK